MSVKCLEYLKDIINVSGGSSSHVNPGESSKTSMKSSTLACICQAAAISHRIYQINYSVKTTLTMCRQALQDKNTFTTHLQLHTTLLRSKEKTWKSAFLKWLIALCGKWQQRAASSKLFANHPGGRKEL